MKTESGNKPFQGLKIQQDKAMEVSDWIVGERPLQILINGKPYTVTMCTPGNEEYLVRGLLFTENIHEPSSAITVKTVENKSYGEAITVSVWIEPGLLKEGYFQRRSLLSVSSCGICGKRELSDLELRGYALKRNQPLKASMIPSLFKIMKERQRTFHETGGAHAAAIFTGRGQLLSIQEDIGRHNAVDKAIGQLITGNQLSQGIIMLVSGRISFEIVSKCYKARFPYLAAVSSPSSMAIQTARELGICLLAFCREGVMTCYSHEERLAIENRSKIQV